MTRKKTPLTDYVCADLGCDEPRDTLNRGENVIAIDPGGRTGWSSAWMNTDEMIVTGNGVLSMERFEPWFAERQGVGRLRSVKGDIERNMLMPDFQTVVYETWIPRRDEESGTMDWIEGDPLIYIQHVGAIRYIAQTSGARIVTQNPSEKHVALASMPQVLLALDEFSSEQHDKDARMHLWLYWFRNWFTGAVDPEKAVRA